MQLISIILAQKYNLPLCIKIIWRRMRKKLKHFLFPAIAGYFIGLKAEVFHVSSIRNVFSDLIWMLFSVQCKYLAKSILTIVQNSILAVQSWPIHILKATWCQIHLSSLVNCLIGREGKGGKYCINYFAVKQTYLLFI